MVRRIAVIGTTGSGKTTLARTLSHHLHIPHIELDSLYWGPDWTEAPLPLFRSRVTDALSEDEWVVDGNYSKVQDITLSRANTIVWLDYSLPVMMRRLLRRTLRRILKNEVLWSNNRESWRGAFWGRDSLFWWQVTTYRRRRREYQALFVGPEYAHHTVIRLRSPGEDPSKLTKLMEDL